MSIELILLLVASYFLGGIPTAYVAGRLIRGIDLRRYGSGTVSGSMVWEHVAHWAIVPVVLIDIGKAALPTWLALRLGLGHSAAAAAGFAAAAGHNWSPYLGFTGGRGLGLFVGMMLVLFPWGVAWLAGAVAIGFFLGDSAPWALPALITMPLLARRIDGPDFVPALSLAMMAITVIKRLEANQRPLPHSGPERQSVLLRRIFFDRDIASLQDWIRREPEDGVPAPANALDERVLGRLDQS